MSKPISAFAGIDVACAKGKRLPVCVCTLEEGRLTPLPLRERDFPKPPAGRGNPGTLEPELVSDFAREALAYLQAVESIAGVKIGRVALDAPRAYSQAGRRACEQAMDDLRISCFPTPTRKDFQEIREKARAHLVGGGSISRLPHANEHWMTVGFALFERLGGAYECLEVFPQATVRRLGIEGKHKSKREGLQRQLAAVAAETGWTSAEDLEANLKTAGYGALHDRLDAFMCAWVASLPPPKLKAHGNPPHDVIWVPA